MNQFKIAFLFYFLLISCGNAVAVSKEISGKVIGVKDGDTIEILFEGKPLAIRLAHIDCPELKKGQPFARAAKKFTSDLCFGKVITVQGKNKYDRYHRLIGVVYNDKGQNVNKELVKAGLAWHFVKYSSDKEYDALEKIARQNKIGLWADDHPTPPWDWRKSKMPKAKWTSNTF